MHPKLTRVINYSWYKGMFGNMIQIVFLKILKFFLFKMNFFNTFLDRFDMLITKIILKK
jgi:hypothetical protein